MRFLHLPHERLDVERRHLLLCLIDHNDRNQAFGQSVRGRNDQRQEEGKRRRSSDRHVVLARDIEDAAFRLVLRALRRVL